MSCPHFIPAMCRKCGETNCGGDPSKCALNGTRSANAKSFAEMLDLYRLTAADRVAKGRMEPASAKIKPMEMRLFLRVMNINADGACEVTKMMLQEYYDRLIASGYSASAAYAHVEKVRGFFCAWMRERCDELGIGFEAPQMPRDLDKGTNRKKVADDEKTAIKLWYQSLVAESNKSLRAFALFMRKYAMRPNDVARLKWSQMDGGVLRYMPHKTSRTSRRTVEVTMAATDIEEIRRYREWRKGVHRGGGSTRGESEYVFGGGKCDYIIDELNKSIRKATGHRLYILRALCITEHYVRAGVGAAKAISGDNKVRTLDNHYIFENAVKVAALEDC